MDINFFANPEWRFAVDFLNKTKQPVDLMGVDVRIMDEEQCTALNTMRLKRPVHIAWDLPQIDLTEKLNKIVKHISPNKLVCYVLIGFNSTKEQDLYRVSRLRELGIVPFVQPYRDYENKRTPTQYEKDFARWSNNRWFYKTCKFKDFEPRKGFKCSEYLKQQ